MYDGAAKNPPEVFDRRPGSYRTNYKCPVIEFHGFVALASDVIVCSIICHGRR